LLQDGALTSSALFYAYCVIAAHAQTWMDKLGHAHNMNNFIHRIYGSIKTLKTNN